MSTITQINLSKYPKVYNSNYTTPLWVDLYDYFRNPTKVNKANWNLACSRRDLGMWVEFKMKANRHWKVSDVKKYFDIKGSGEKLLENFEEVYTQYEALMDEILEAVNNGDQIELTFID